VNAYCPDLKELSDILTTLNSKRILELLPIEVTNADKQRATLKKTAFKPKFFVNIKRFYASVQVKSSFNYKKYRQST